MTHANEIVNQSNVLSPLCANDVSDELMIKICDECNLSLDQLHNLVVKMDIQHVNKNNLLSIWSFLHKYEFKNRNKIRNKFIDYIYIDLDYMIDLDTTITTSYLIDSTCIGSDDPCRNMYEAAAKGHYDCLTRVKNKMIFPNIMEISLAAIRGGNRNCLNFLILKDINEHGRRDDTRNDMYNFRTWLRRLRDVTNLIVYNI